MLTLVIFKLVIFHFAIVLIILPRIAVSDYHFSVFQLLL